MMSLNAVLFAAIALLARAADECEMISVEQDSGEQSVKGAANFFGSYENTRQLHSDRPVFKSIVPPWEPTAKPNYLYFIADLDPEAEGLWAISPKLGDSEALMTIKSKAKHPSHILSTSDWNMGVPGGLDVPLPISGVHITCVEKFVADASTESKPSEQEMDMKEVKMKVKFANEKLQTFNVRKQQQIIFSLESIIAERAVRKSNNIKQDEAFSAGFHVVIAKIAMEEQVDGQIIMTPKLKCSAGQTYPCDLKMPLGIKPNSRAETAMIVDAFLQSKQQVVTAVVSLLEAPQFPSGLKEMIQSNPNTQIHGSIEITGVSVSSKLSSAVQPKEIEVADSLTNTNQVHNVKMIVMNGVAQMQPHHWVMFFFFCIGVSTGFTILKAKSMYNQQFLEWRRQRRLRDPNVRASKEMQEREQQDYLDSMRQASALVQENDKEADLERGSVRRRSSARHF